MSSNLEFNFLTFNVRVLEYIFFNSEYKKYGMIQWETVQNKLNRTELRRINADVHDVV